MCRTRARWADSSVKFKREEIAIVIRATMQQLAGSFSKAVEEMTDVSIH